MDNTDHNILFRLFVWRYLVESVLTESDNAFSFLESQIGKTYELSTALQNWTDHNLSTSLPYALGGNPEKLPGCLLSQA